MKKLLAALLLVTMAYYAQSQCNPYYTIESGDSWEITSYNNKDKVEGRQTTEVVSFEENGSGWDAVMHFKTYDKKDELVMENDDVAISCDDGIITLDMERFLPQQMMESFRDMNMKIDVDNIELPSELEVGQGLDEGSITVSGDIPMTVRVDITNRKVEGKETVTTPAGTFDCYKISYDMKTKMMMGIESSGIDWIAKDVGVVKSEVYKKNGKLMSYSLLTKVK